ncbi:MAG: histidine--tRNA ligase [Acidobacteria bacterium]|nr:histidine--tRNA ligase [Acidobacteriota bacterium]MCA1611669.1 histidine--tRNA ligase [Acidobacteriota bacterium]
MSPAYRAVKGTRDLLPPESEKYAAVESIARQVFGGYGYGEIRTPILESTELFSRSVGETTDIVHKEMYTFLDRKGRSLTLRPENTAGVVRAALERGIDRMPRPLRLWYAGEQFRYERPQKGRYREFRQIGAEMIGVPGSASDAEVLVMLFDFLQRLGFIDLSVTLNCVPGGAGREAFADALRSHVRPRARRLGEDDRRRVEENPLRLFDSKDPETKAVLEGAPTTVEFLDPEAASHYAEVKEFLRESGIPFTESPALVRGLDYYTVTVFEVVSKSLGAQNAILGGGRYDNLFADLGGPPLPAVGFAIGEDRLVEVLPGDPREPRELWYVLPGSPEDFPYAMAVARALRSGHAGAVVETDLSGRGFAKGFTRASAILAGDADYPFRVSEVRVVSVGSQERAEQTVKIKTLSARREEAVPLAALTRRSRT